MLFIQTGNSLTEVRVTISVQDNCKMIRVAVSLAALAIIVSNS